MQTITHIGQPKTGTTSLQHFLRNNREALESQGIYVASSIFDHHSPSHYVLNLYSLANQRSSPMKDELVKLKGEAYISWIQKNLSSEVQRIYDTALEKKCTRIIWSNEGLYFLNSIAEYQKLYDLFKPYSSEVCVICCLRSRDSFRVSYSDELKKQKIAQVQESDSYRHVEAHSWLFDYERKKKLLETVFDKTYLFDYQPKNNTRVFFEVLGIPMDVKTEPKLNLSSKRTLFKKFLHLFRKLLIP